MSYKVLGYEWWQWDSHGDSRPGKKYDIKVIVYRNISSGNVKEMYPVIQEIKQDYRYIEYNMAIQYLDEQIKKVEEWKDTDPETFIPELLTRLKRTKEKVEKQLEVKEHSQ